MGLEELNELVNGVKELTGKLRAENDDVNKTLSEYASQIKDCGTSTVKDMKKELAEIEKDLLNLQKQATDKMVIEFVGAVNSGKSSVINALLREDILPTASGDATKCSFKICTTNEESWSAQLNEGEKRYGKDVEEIKQLYCQMSDSTIREKQRALGIKRESVVQLNWPQTLCEKLPENVVLYDTPGIGVDKEVDKLVKNSCETADIIVPVMDTNSSVEQLLEDVKGKFMFGVYTKWDEFVERNSKKKGSFDKTFYQKQRKDSFLAMVKGRREAGEEAKPQAEKDAKVGTELKIDEAKAKTEREAKAKQSEEVEFFFIDVGCVEYDNVMFANCQGSPFTDTQVETDGTEGNKAFLKFEKRLAESAKELKGVIIKERVDSVTLKSVKGFNKFQGIIDTQRKEKKAKLDRFEDEVAFLIADLESISEIKQAYRSTGEIIDAAFTEDVFEALKTELKENAKGCKSEKKALEKFHDSVNARIKDALDTETRKVKRKYEEWKSNLKSSYEDLSESLPDYEVPCLEYQDLPKEYYNKWKDIHTYITSKMFWGITGVTVATGCAVLGGAAAAPALAVAVEETVKAGAAGALLGGGTTSATAIALNNVFDGNKMSDKKVRARNKFDEDEIKAMTKSEVYKEPISKELNRIFKGISSQLKGVLNSTEKESQQLHKEIEDLNKWIADLKKSVASVQEVNKTFGELLRKLENTKADSEDQTVNQSVTSNDGTSV